MSESSSEKPASPGKVNRRTFLKRSAIAATAGAAAVAGGSYWLGGAHRASRSHGKKVIIIGIDGMDPVLSQTMINQDLLPNLKKLREAGAFSKLGTSIPPQSPVAWANFINGNGPGSHGIFDFVHRHPEHPTAPFSSFAETLPGEGFWDVGDHQLQLDFWPFNHKPAATVLRRQGVPFWDFLDAEGIPTTFYDLPCNYPPSPSNHGHHRCISGMGTPDMLGTYGTYQYFAEDGPETPQEESGGKRTRLIFSAETAKATIIGPGDSLRTVPRPITVEFLVHRDRDANSAVIELQGQKIILRPGEWSRWIKLDFALSTPWFVPGQSASGICRFYLQKIEPLRLYMSPVNIDPSAPAVKMSEPDSFLPDVSKRLGLFPTAGFQEDYQARNNGIFNDDEFAVQANKVLEERLALLEHALKNYDDGLLYFYFSSSDLQSHIMWWDNNDKHPIREGDDAKKYFGFVKRLYQKLDEVIGELVDRYGSQATIIVMSDHGFANFGRQFNLNSWLRLNQFLGPPECTSLMRDVDWSKTYAYGLGINGLYLNMKGREPHGVVEPGEQKELVIGELIRMLEGIRDDEQHGGGPVIKKVYRADQVYSGNATALAPDLIVGYARNYRASWATTLGDLTDEWLLDNDSPWSADHCVDALEVPGVFYSNKAISAADPWLVDVAPSILAEYGIATPSSMVGRKIFK